MSVLTASWCPLHSPCPCQGPVTVKHHGQQLKVDLVASHVAAAAGRLLAGEVWLVLGWSTAVHRALAAVFSTHMPCIPSGLFALHLFVCTCVCETGFETWALAYRRPCRVWWRVPLPLYRRVVGRQQPAPRQKLVMFTIPMIPRLLPLALSVGMRCVIAPRLAAEEVAKGGLDTLHLLLLEAGAQLLEPQQLPSTLQQQQQQQTEEASGEGEGQMVSQQVTQPPVTAAQVPQGPPKRQESGRKRGRAHSAAAAAAVEPVQPPPVLVLVSGVPAAAPLAARTPGKGSRKAGGGAGAAGSAAAGTSSKSPMARRGSGALGRRDSSEPAGEQQDSVYASAGGDGGGLEEDGAWCSRMLPAGFQCYSRDWLVRSLLLQRCDWGDAVNVVAEV